MSKIGRGRNCDNCELWVSKSNTTPEVTKSRKNEVLAKKEINSFASAKEPVSKTLLISDKSHFIKAKVSVIKKIKYTYFNKYI